MKEKNLQRLVGNAQIVTSLTNVKRKIGTTARRSRPEMTFRLAISKNERFYGWQLWKRSMKKVKKSKMFSISLSVKDVSDWEFHKSEQGDVWRAYRKER